MPEWQKQEEIFEEAKKSISDELSPEMANWSFAQMVGVLKVSIKANRRPDNHDSTGTFCMKYLKKPGQSYKIVRNEIQGCFKGRELMKEETVIDILRTLKSLQGVPLSLPANLVSAEATDSTEVVTPQSGIVRKLVLLVITMLNSYAMVIAEANVKPNDVFDSDRMQMRSALQKICKAFGIEANFPELRTKIKPVTFADLEDMGIPNNRRVL